MRHIRKTNKNWLIVASISIIVACSVCITGISAYFIATKEAINSVSIGHAQIVINEEFVNPDIEPLVVTTITKKVSIENIGPNSCSVRVRAEFSNEDVLSYTSVDYDTENWTYSNGYWYYNKVLKANDWSNDMTRPYETTPLFSKLVLDRPTQDQIDDFDVYVYAECRNCAADENPMNIWN